MQLFVFFFFGIRNFFYYLFQVFYLFLAKFDQIMLPRPWRISCSLVCCYARITRGSGTVEIAEYPPGLNPRHQGTIAQFGKILEPFPDASISEKVGAWNIHDLAAMVTLQNPKDDVCLSGHR